MQDDIILSSKYKARGSLVETEDKLQHIGPDNVNLAYSSKILSHEINC